jgi:hypothetical protein
MLDTYQPLRMDRRILLGCCAFVACQAEDEGCRRRK